MGVATIFLQDADFITAAYIVAFSLFIIGLSRLTSPTTAVQGNKLAASTAALASPTAPRRAGSPIVSSIRTIPSPM